MLSCWQLEALANEGIAQAQMHAMSRKTTLKANAVKLQRFNQAGACERGDNSTFSAGTMEEQTWIGAASHTRVTLEFVEQFFSAISKSDENKKRSEASAKQQVGAPTSPH